MTTSHQRVAAALNFQETDRVPLDIGATNVSGIALSILKKLLDYHKFRDDIEIPDHIQQIGICPNFFNFLGVDTQRIGPPRIIDFDNKVVIKEKQREISDRWEIKYVMKDGGKYFDQVYSPLSQENELGEALKKYIFPSPNRKNIENSIKKKFDPNNLHFPILDRDCAGLFEMATRLRGFEKFLIDLMIDTKHAAELLDRILDYKMNYWKIALETFNGEEAVIAEADDYGTESSLIISEDLLRKLFFPRLKKLFAFIKNQNPKVKIFFHCDGAIREILPDLIEAGVDILNPVQFTARNMELESLKKDFGKEIVFWGGGIDTQKTLPFGSPEEVKDEVKKNIDIMATGGGFVFSTVHNIQADVPLENLLALLTAFRENCNY